jgi:radical SAM superfamily enzyme YgiQ (UPF0313 family)
MKKILLLSPCSAEKIERSYLGPTLGVVRLAGFLTKKGHDAEYFDPSLWIATGKSPSLEDKLRQKEWDFIGISCLDETLLTDIRHIHLANELCPCATLIVGGIEAQFNYQTILDKTPCNIVILGEGEIPLLKIIEGEPLHKIPGVAFKSNAEPLDQELFIEATTSINWEDVPYEAYWDYYVDKYGDRINDEKNREIHTVRVFSRNRCPIGCKFCSSTNQLTWGSGEKVPVISTTESSLIGVIKRIIAAHPRTKTIYLTDDDFCINKASVRRFCEKVVAEDFGDLTFMCFARVTDLDEKLLRIMKQANFRRLIIGVESFSQSVLDDMNKRCSVKQIHDALELCNRVGIKPHINIILTTPYSTLDDIETSIHNALWYISNDYVVCAVISSIRPLKGTEYFEVHSNYMTTIVDIPNSPYKIKMNEFIWAKNPVVREIQEEYWRKIDGEVERYSKSAGLRHKNTNDIARVSLLYMKKLISEARAKYNLQKAEIELPHGSNCTDIENSFADYLATRDKTKTLTDRKLSITADDLVTNKRVSCPRIIAL